MDKSYLSSSQFGSQGGASGWNTTSRHAISDDIRLFLPKKSIIVSSSISIWIFIIC